MPNVICILDPEQHLALKAEARRNFRTLGNQILAMAFGAAGVPRPPPPSKPGAAHRAQGGTSLKPETKNKAPSTVP